jgi:hypothetical protein
MFCVFETNPTLLLRWVWKSWGNVIFMSLFSECGDDRKCQCLAGSSHFDHFPRVRTTTNSPFLPFTSLGLFQFPSLVFLSIFMLRFAHLPPQGEAPQDSWLLRCFGV